MTAFLSAIVVVVGVALGASLVLENLQKTADSAYVGKGAKPDPEPSLRTSQAVDKKH